MKKKKLSMCILVGILFLVTLFAITGKIYAKRTGFQKQTISVTVGSSITNKLQNTQKGYKIVYKSNNTKIATITKSGKITGKKPGKVKISALYKKKKYWCSVTVKAKKTSPTAATKTTSPVKTAPPTTEKDGLKVVYIDVGQGDSILIKNKVDNVSILIDCGNDEPGDLQEILNTLKDENVSSLDCVVLTHWHEDHIGSFRYLPSRIPIKSVFIRENINKVSSKVYDYTMESITDNKIPVIYPKAGETFFKTDYMQLICVGPVNAEKYDDENANSLAFVLTFGDTKFYFGGDSPQEAEADMLSNYPNLLENMDCFKADHHGSTYSNSYALLHKMTDGRNADKPFYSVISCGVDNSYYHPHKATLDRLQQAGAVIYRTDTMGNVEIVSDGKVLSASTEKNTPDYSNMPIPTASQNANTYIGNINSKIVHTSTCSTLPAEKNRIYFSDIEKALSDGYRKCSNCFR